MKCKKVASVSLNVNSLEKTGPTPAAHYWMSYLGKATPHGDFPTPRCQISTAGKLSQLSLILSQPVSPGSVAAFVSGMKWAISGIVKTKNSITNGSPTVFSIAAKAGKVTPTLKYG